MTYKHGSPADRGSADAYYSRPANPHWYPSGTGKGLRIESAAMTKEEINEYLIAYYVENKRKEYPA